ncbi:MAG: DedA family protein [Actinomycetota bacterium]|nr:DedA family protein [Actinomycetota bacterium]
MLSGMQLAALITPLLDWLEPFFASFGYVIVSVAMFFESAAFTGILVPGDVILALGGVYAGRGELALPAVIACGAIFGVVGSSTGYLLGRRYGKSILRRAPILRRFQDRLDRAQASIAANAGKTIVLGRFITGAAVFVPFVAGASGVRARTFFTYAIPTMLVWSAGLALLGFFVGNNVDTIDRILSRVGLAGLGLGVLVVGLWIWRQRRNDRTLDGSQEDLTEETDEGR